PENLAISPDGSRVYVSNRGAGGSVSVIDTAGNIVVHTIPLNMQPAGVAFRPPLGRFVYVTRQATNLVTIIDNDAVPPAVGPTITVGTGPTDVAFTPDGQFAYITNSVSNTVSVIDATLPTPAVVHTIPVGTGPVAVKIRPSGDRAYVVNQLPLQQNGFVTVINTLSSPPAVITTVPVGIRPFDAA